jgi:DNA-binding MarR family transcriptional regulator
MAGGNGQAGIGQGDLLDLVGYNMKRAYMRIHADFTATLEGLGLRQRTFSVLSLVVQNDGISQSDVARMLGIERSGTVVIVDELEDRGLISRDKVPGDRRAWALTPTDLGRALYETARARIAAHEEALLSGFSATERTALLAFLKRIHELEA